MDWGFTGTWEEVGLGSLPSRNVSDFYYKNTPFTFTIGPNPYEHVGPQPPTMSYEEACGEMSRGAVISKGDRFRVNRNITDDQIDAHYIPNDVEHKRPKDEDWEDIQSVTETSVTSSDGSLTDSPDDDPNMSQMNSSDFKSLGTTYSASSETTDRDTYESDDTVDSQEDTEASELTDYEAPVDKQSQEKVKDILHDDPHGRQVDKHTRPKHGKPEIVSTTHLRINDKDYYTNDPEYFAKHLAE